MNAIGNNEPAEDNRVLLGQSKVMNVPEGFAEGSLSWSNVSREIVDALADEWFAEYKPQPISKVLPKNATAGQDLAAQTFAGHLFAGEGVNLLPGLEISLGDLGEQVSIPESTIGKALLEVLDKNGISWSYKTHFVNSFLVLEERPDSTLDGVAQWASYFEMPVIQNFRVFKNTKGVETILWSAPMLMGSRPMFHLDTIDFNNTHFEVTAAEAKKGTLPFGQWSSKMHIPAVFKRIFFLSETPFPSSIMNMPRSMALKEVDPKNYPKPVMFQEFNQWFDGFFAHDGQRLLDIGSPIPEAISAGWTFTTANHDEIQTILEVVTDGLVRFASFLEDGYLNFRGNDFGFPYDLALFSGLCMDEKAIAGSSARGRSQWVPAVRLGLELAFTAMDGSRRNELKQSGNSPELRKVLEHAVYEGVGRDVPTLINDYAFSFLMPEKNWDEAQYILDTAIYFDLPIESANSMSNLAAMHFKLGNLDEARRLFLLALERLETDQGGVSAESVVYIPEIQAEGYYYLSGIAKAQGNSTESEDFAKKCQEHGGYTPEEEREAPAAPTASGLGGSGAKIGGGSGGKIGADSPEVPATPSGSGGLPSSGGRKIGGDAPSAPEPAGLGGGGAKIGGGSGGKIGGSDTPTAKFCASCGNKFGSDAEKFCGGCGSKRN